MVCHTVDHCPRDSNHVELLQEMPSWWGDDASQCPSCGLKKWTTSFDVRLSTGTWAVTFEELENTAKAGCQDCELILDAALTYIRPTARLENTKVQVYPEPRGRRLYIHIKAISDLEEECTELELVRYQDRSASFAKSATSLDGPVWDIMTQALPSGHTLSPLTQVKIENWILQCDLLHEACRKSRVQALPSRILELLPDMVRVRGKPEVRGVYACLSHCWGADGPSIKLTSCTANDLKLGIPISQLPRTFRDAVHVCQSLRIKYLWIDALCIEQDDIQDWMENAAHMASIFENACLNLAATSAPHSEGGLFGLDADIAAKQLQHHPQIYVRHRKRVSEFPRTYRQFSSTRDEKSRSEFPLLNRAWVYQERRLSRRTIHFTRQQVFWECNSRFISEDKTIDTSWDYGVDHQSTAIHARPFGYWSGDPVADWKKTVSEFQGLQLTFETDRLPAIAALAERMMRFRRGKDTYIAGMWKNTLLSDLSWYHFGQSYPRPAGTTPSWSWASIQGNVMWAEATPLPVSEIIDIQYTRVGPKNIGDAVGAHIVVRGLVIHGHYTTGKSPDEQFTVPYWVSLAIHNLPSSFSDVAVSHFYPDYKYTEATPPVNSGDPLKGLILYKEKRQWTGLVLRKAKDNPEQYERIGLFSVQHKNYRERFSQGHKEVDTSQVGEYIASLPVERVCII
ncbi:heterokaryon incompatibility protein-domain-containing protein [Stachybotrys elegans]|uniref:Heterokaryon incompatibility protein-domain-containing protein n=1 Tax=Stachybotrys elegans TaxID=80388 RepID=A0A8K0SK49_9HYPO|nr:heterokaryon incompatibility protein-domain-containing protein [Stachybotrys elegans]